MKKTLLGLALLVTMSPAMAATTGHYVGVSLGQTNLNAPSEVEQFVSDDTDTGYKLYTGYKITQYVAVEGYYADLGDIDLVDGSELGADTFGVSVVGSYPVNEAVDVYGKLGFNAWEADGSSDDGVDPAYGVGVSFTEGDITLKAEYERFEMDDVDFDMASVGIQYNF
ncbi:porin family protein [Vibrio owensii]|jgi:OOP family OmpA-OmpF porin|uniref:porin family protein n=1 Tax=Vibrio harveyi group TaxID=717610 RepID=UPI003CC6C9BA